MSLSIEITNFNEAKEELVLRCHGTDRPGIISGITGRLESCRLYVDSIVFNLMLPSTYQCDMQLVAKGSLQDLRSTLFLVETNAFKSDPDLDLSALPKIHWPDARLFHVALMTPDRPGLVAKIADIVGKRRDTSVPHLSTVGSFVHLIGTTHNSGGPQGGTAYFSLRANVAAQTLEVQRDLMLHLTEWAKKNGISNDLWLCDLNHPPLGTAR